MSRTQQTRPLLRDPTYEQPPQIVDKVDMDKNRDAEIGQLLTEIRKDQKLKLQIVFFLVIFLLLILPNLYVILLYNQGSIAIPISLSWKPNPALKPTAVPYVVETPMLVSKHNQPASYTYLYAKDKLPYRYAVHYCQTHGGQLPSVHSLEDNLNLLRIGLLYRNIKRGHEHVVPGFWLGAESVRGDQKFEWVDGTPWNFEHWFDRQPDRPGSAENCIEMVSYSPAKWNNVKCDLKLHFICKLPSN